MRAPWLSLPVVLQGCAGSPVPPADAAPPSAVVAAPANEPAPTPPPRTSVEPTMIVHLGATAVMSDDATLELVSIVSGTIAADPSGTYPAGPGLVVTAALRRAGIEIPIVLEYVSAGYTARSVAWADDLRVTLLRADSHGETPYAALIVERAHFEAGAPAQSLTMTRGKAVALGDGLEVTLTGHGHKITEAGGPPSPLIVRLQYAEPGRAPVDQELHLDDPPAPWTFRDLHFELVAYEYDQRMDVTLRRAKMRRIELPPG